MVYLKMVTGTPYEVRMFYQKLKKWSSVWLIKYVWFNIFWLFGPKYVLIPTYGLFETEEYYAEWLCSAARETICDNTIQHVTTHL